MNYTTNDKLNELRVGDTLTLEDGSVHKAVKDDPAIIYCGCQYCSLCPCPVNTIKCVTYSFYFKQIKP
jgi:hypothetical protein